MTIIDVIRNEGKRGLLAWKYPPEELGNWSQLIVREGEEAVLFASGRAADRFTAGRYTLKTANIPLLRSLVSLPFGGKSPFTAELWYVNVGKTLDIKWGTDAPILLSGNDEQPSASMRGYGLLGVRITDAGLFLSSLRGNVDSFDELSLAVYLRGQFSEVIRQSIAACLMQFGSGFFENAESSRLLSEQLQANATPIAARYGMEPSCLIISDLCVASQDSDSERHITFSIMSIVLPSVATAIPMEMPVAQPKHRRTPIVTASFILLLLLLLVFGILLPPRQTADFVGIAFATVAHCLATLVAIWTFIVRRGLLVTVGFCATTVLYWLGTVGVTLVFRLFSATETGLLMALELGMTGVAALALMGFWYGRIYDTTFKEGDDFINEE